MDYFKLHFHLNYFIASGDILSTIFERIHHCFFRQAFDLLEFDIQELEESLLLMNSEDDSLQLVQRLVIKLLKGCSNTYSKNITTDVSTHALNKRNTL